MRHLSATSGEDASRQERELREFSFLDLPYDVAGVSVRGMTLDDFSILMAKKTPFICGGIVEREDCALFLWLLSVECEQAISGTEKAMNAARRAFMKKISALDFDAVKIGIETYIEKMFFDEPRGGKSEGEATYCFQTSFVGYVALHYHWSEKEIRALPLPRLFGYIRQIEKHLDPEAVQFNGLEDDVDMARFYEMNAPK